MEAFLTGTADGWCLLTSQFPLTSLLLNRMCHWHQFDLFLPLPFPSPLIFLKLKSMAVLVGKYIMELAFLCSPIPSKIILIVITEGDYELRALQEKLEISLVMLNILC